MYSQFAGDKELYYFQKVQFRYCFGFDIVTAILGVSSKWILGPRSYSERIYDIYEYDLFAANVFAFRMNGRKA